jgi:hypothetical protein
VQFAQSVLHDLRLPAGVTQLASAYEEESTALGSMQHWDLEVARADFRAARVVEASPTGLGAGETLLVVERLALTANTMTYAALGDELNYWGLFPASPGFGRIPAWGTASSSIAGRRRSRLENDFLACFRCRPI